MQKNNANHFPLLGALALAALLSALLPACQEVPLDSSQTQPDSFSSVHPSTGMQGFKAMSGWNATGNQIQPSTPFPGGFKGF